jgi:hypothetical protein
VGERGGRGGKGGKEKKSEKKKKFKKNLKKFGDSPLQTSQTTQREQILTTIIADQCAGTTDDMQMLGRMCKHCPGLQPRHAGSQQPADLAF